MGSDSDTFSMLISAVLLSIDIGPKRNAALYGPNVQQSKDLSFSNESAIIFSNKSQGNDL